MSIPKYISQPLGTISETNNFESEFNTASANGKFLLQIFTSVAEFERNLISERTKVGLVNVRKRNKFSGRSRGPKKETIEKYQFTKHL